MERYHNFEKQKYYIFYLGKNSVYTVMDYNFIIDLNIYLVNYKVCTISAKDGNYI